MGSLVIALSLLAVAAGSPATSQAQVLTGPTTTIDSGPEDPIPTSDSTPTFGFSSSDPLASLACLVDGGSFSPCSSPWTVGPLTDGPHTFQAQATDALGNPGPPASRSFTVDTTGPSVTIDSGPQGPTSDSTPTFAFSPSETEASLECRIDSASFSSCSSPFTASTLSDGAHTFDVRAIDSLGNVGSVASRSFTVDTIGPSVTISSGPQDPNPTSDSTPSFSFSASETGASLECRIDSASFSSCSSPFTASTLSEGAHTFEVRASDALGNVGPVASRSFTVDTAVPHVDITGGPDGPTNDSSPTFTFAGGSGWTFECQLDGATVGCSSGSFTPGSSLQDGTHTFRVRATNQAGTTGPFTTRTFTVDTVAPNSSLTGGPRGPTSDSTPTFAFASEPGASFQCKVDAGSFTDCTSPRTLGPLPNGPHTFAVRARDAAGNQDASPASASFVVDTTPPQTVITSGPPASSTDGTPTFAFQASEGGAKLECSLDGSGFSACTSPSTFGPLPAGQHGFAVRARDAAGNVDASPASLAFTIVAPASSQPPPDDGRAKAFAAALVLGLKRVVGRLGSSELPAVLGRRGVTLRRVEVLAQGTVRVTAKVRRGPSRGATVLRGSRRFETAGKGSLRLRLTRAGRRLFRLARRVRLTVTYTYTAPSGTRLTASERVSMWRIYLTLREVAGVARRGIRHYFGDRPVSLTLRDCTRSGPTRVYCRHVLWRHAGRWWYARLRVRETATGLRRSMSNAYSF